MNETGRKNFRTTRIYFSRINAEISEKLKVDMKEYCLIEQYSWHYILSFSPFILPDGKFEKTVAISISSLINSSKRCFSYISVSFKRETYRVKQLFRFSDFSHFP